MENLIQKFSEVLIPWLLTSGLKITAILIAAFVIHKIAKAALAKIIRKTVAPNHFLSEEAEKKREDTLIRIFHGTIHVLVIIMAALMIISELGVNIGPLLAGAGIAGLAFGFGAQYLIRDLIAGFFSILENQYRVGDVVCFGKTCGLVEDINLRTTVLRDLDGTVHHVPHGEASTVSNLSKDLARVNLDIGIAYETDLEKVISVVNRVGNEMAEDPDFKDMIIEPPQFLRVNDFADSAIMIKILGDTKPLKQWDVTGELRKRLKIAFDKEGIEIPYPHRTIVQKSH